MPQKEVRVKYLNLSTYIKKFSLKEEKNMKKFKKVFYILIIGLFLLSLISAQQQSKLLTILTWANFVPESDQYLAKLAEEFGKKYNAQVRIDIVSLNDFSAKLAAEIQSNSGHDIILLMNYSTALYKNYLIPVNDVVSRVQIIYGSYVSAAKEAAMIEGNWYSVPCYYTPSPGVYRKDYFAQAGINPPDTYDELLKVAEKLYKIGHPIGLPISHCGDSNDWLFMLLNSFGAKAIDSKGNVTINSPQTRKAMEYVKELSKYMPPDILAWDGSGNNKWILSGVGSYIINSMSVVAAAKSDFPDIYKNIGLVLPPKGPAGRFETTSMYSYGITKWSKNQTLAKQFLRFLFEENNFKSWVEASKGYNMPLFTNMTKFKTLQCWGIYPDVEVLFNVGKLYHLPLWPAPAGGSAQLTYDSYIIPDMFANYITGRMSMDDAIKWAEQQLTQIWKK
jgi:multiple sugar transport system substrate-binding protein